MANVVGSVMTPKCCLFQKDNDKIRCVNTDQTETHTVVAIVTICHLVLISFMMDSAINSC